MEGVGTCTTAQLAVFSWHEGLLVNSIRINRTRFSEAVWDNIFEDAKWREGERRRLNAALLRLNSLRSDADYNTGSITADSGWVYFCIANFFKPKVIAEVGTFIGRTTTAVAWGAKDAEIHTCDSSNDIKIPTYFNIHQYPKKTSTEMFKTLADIGITVDMVILDGRLTPEDGEPLGKIVTYDTVFVLDDFEGVEKGVVNASLLLQSLGQYYHLVYPPKHLNTGVAMLVPRKLIEYTNQ